MVQPSLLVIGFSELSAMLITIVFFIFIIAAIRASYSSNQITHANWHQYVDNQPFSTQEFYAALQEHIKVQNIPDISFSLVRYPQGGLFSQARVYLRVQCKEYIFDVCAAPFGNGSFVSWWMGELTGGFRSILTHIPFVGRLFVKREKTFFELDNETLFKERFSASVKAVFEHLTAVHGKRSLAENN
jgi:hypothetical protein